jgi:capsular polysaccharide biosynthesis protein
MSSRALIAAGCVAVGCAAGVVLAIAMPARYHAEATMVAELSGLPAAPTDVVDAKPLVATVAKLATSDTVVENVAGALDTSPTSVRAHLRASTVPGTALFRLSYEDRSKLQAARVVEQAAAVVSSLVTSRFAGSSRRLTAAVTDPPRATRLDAPWRRDGLLGALAGALAGAGWFALSRRRVRPESALEGDFPAVPATVGAPALLVEVRAALADKGAEFDEDQVLRWEAYLDELEGQAAGGPLPAHLEELAAGFFAPLLKP